MRSMFAGSRGKLTPGLMLVLAAVAIVLATGVWWLSQQHRTAQQAQHGGEVGAVSTFQFDRDKGINPPYADQGAAGTASPDATLELPFEWKDVPQKTTAASIDAAYEAMGKKLTKDGEVYKDTLTLKVDRDLTYRQFYTAYAKAVEAGFLKIQVACYPKPTEKELRFLPMDPPQGAGSPKGVLYFRLLRDGYKIRYLLGGSKPQEYEKLVDVVAVMKKMKEQGMTTRTLVIWPEPECTVQNFVEAVNVGEAAGFQNISLKSVSME